MSEINVVPYIDVMLVLLVIFMITAPLLTQGVKVDLPKTESAPLPPDGREPVIINVNKDGEYFINYGENQDKPISPQDLANRVNAVLELNEYKIPVLVGGDNNVPYGRIVELMALLQNAGVEGVGMLTDPIE